MLEEEIKQLSRDLDRLFNRIGAANAFGNEEIVKIVRQLQALVDYIDETDPCPVCQGTGGSKHECDCPHCDLDIDECFECDRGRVEKVNPKTI